MKNFSETFKKNENKIESRILNREKEIEKETIGKPENLKFKPKNNKKLLISLKCISILASSQRVTILDHQNHLNSITYDKTLISLPKVSTHHAKQSDNESTDVIKKTHTTGISIKKNRKRHVTKMVVAVVVTFAVCWLPIQIIFLISSFSTYPSCKKIC